MAFPIPIIAAGVAGLASLIGGERRNKAERDAAREQMAFQERMSSTAYQRGMNDMRMSGLNPMLAYAQGGASSPGGAMPGVQDTISPAVSSAMAARRLGEEVQNMRANREVLRQQAANIHTDTLLKGLQHATTQATTAKLLAETEAIPGQMAERAASRSRLLAEADYTRQHSALAALEFPRAKASAQASMGKFGEWMAYIEKLRQSLFGGSPYFYGPQIGGGR